MNAFVVSLWRYPVKSMLGEELTGAPIGERGLLGDRAYALQDVETGKIASAKSPRMWPNLFDFRAAFVEPPREGVPIPPVRISLPSGEDICSEDPSADSHLSGALGRKVRLVSTPPGAPTFEEYWPDIEGVHPNDQRDSFSDERLAVAAPGTFFDATPIHALSTQTLDRLSQLYPEGRFEVRRFRPNIVVRVERAAPGFVENGWVGRTLSIGDCVRLAVVAPTPRCVMTTLLQGDLPTDAGILRTVARHNRLEVPLYGPGACVGVYALVQGGGFVRRGDRVSVI
jgi:hypothetical protein